MNIDVTSKSKLQSFTDFMILHNIHEIKITWYPLSKTEIELLEINFTTNNKFKKFFNSWTLSNNEQAYKYH